MSRDPLANLDVWTARRTAWMGAHKKSSVGYGLLTLVVLFVILGVIGALTTPTKQAAPAKATPSTVAQATQVATTIPPTAAPTQAAPITIQPTRPPSATPRETDTPVPTSTSAPTAIPTATIGPKVQERADFRNFYGHLVGVENLCDDAATIAQKTLSAAEKDTTQALVAYEAAQTAHADCDTAVDEAAILNAPDSLSSFHPDDLVTDSVARMSAIRDEWYDAAQILNSGTADLSTQAILQGHIKDAQTYEEDEAENLAVVIYTLNIKLKNIPPIPPS